MTSIREVTFYVLICIAINILMNVFFLILLGILHQFNAEFPNIIYDVNSMNYTVGCNLLFFFLWLPCFVFKDIKKTPYILTLSYSLICFLSTIILFYNGIDPLESIVIFSIINSGCSLFALFANACMLLIIDIEKQSILYGGILIVAFGGYLCLLFSVSKYIMNKVVNKYF